MKPSVAGGFVVCPCGSMMTCEVFFNMPDNGTWLYWRCTNGHVSAAVPIPPRIEHLI